MREEHKLNKALRQDGIDNQSDLLEELKRRFPQYVEQSETTKAPVKKRRVAVFSAFAAVVVCAAIIVPCAVLLPNSNNGGKDDIRYCAQGEYSRVDVEYTVGEYRESNKRNFLYFDWYALGEDCSTSSYISNSDNEVLCLEEQVYLPQSNEFVQFSITKSNVFLDVFDLTIEHCQNKYTVDSHMVKWGIKGNEAFCIFEDNGYRYFIRVKPGQDENRLFWWVAELLRKN